MQFRGEDVCQIQQDCKYCFQTARQSIDGCEVTVIQLLEEKKITKSDFIISEINDDIIAYKTKYENLVFVVYDLGMIRDVNRFKSSLEANEHVIVIIVKH